MKKRLGISFTKTNFENYWNWFTKEDLQNDIELVELSFEKNNSREINTCDAFLLTGGIDIHPSLYKEDAKGTEKTEIARDLFEKKIFEYSQINNLPILGICRGMQLVNVLQGGKLIQDLENSNATHRKTETDKQHEIQVENDSLLSEVVINSAGKINSAHHQAIDKNALGKNLKISAYSNSDDQTVEGIEFKDKSGSAFMLCVQWHPERMLDKDENTFSQNIKKKFLAEIRNVNVKKLEIINPATEQIIKTINEDDAESIAKKFELLKKHNPHGLQLQ